MWGSRFQDVGDGGFEFGGLRNRVRVEGSDVKFTERLKEMHARPCVGLIERFRMRLGNFRVEDSAGTW